MSPSLSMPVILATLAVGVAAADSLGQSLGPRSGGRSLFERLDQNNDGVLSADEFATSRLGRARAELFERLDSDGDGQLSRTELAAIRNERSRDRDDASRRTLDEPGVAIGSVEQVSRYRDASTYSHAHGGLALLIMRDGEIVYEQYAEGFTRNSAFQVASSTKSFWGPLAAIAVDEGLFAFDDRVSDVLTEWKDDPRKSRITVRHLLSFSSGLEAPRRLWADSKTDKVALALTQPAVHEPGAVFAYSEIHLYAFRAYLERRLRASDRHREFDTAFSYLKARVLDPLGIEITRWKTEADGTPAMGDGAVMTAGHFAKFGELLRRRGMWGDERLVSEATLSEVFASSTGNQAYGLTWWLNKPSEDSSRSADRAGSRARRSTERVSEDGIVPGGLDDLVMAAGAGQQRLYVVPSERLVIVRFANADMPRATMTGQYHLMDLTFEDEEFFSRLLGRDVFP